ncbi:MAG: hypothetical protein GY780_09015 [bacterium]|nr:hypothetical protein [bacterium]
MKKRTLTELVTGVLICVIPALSFADAPHFQNFEGLGHGGDKQGAQQLAPYK